MKQFMSPQKWEAGWGLCIPDPGLKQWSKQCRF